MNWQETAQIAEGQSPTVWNPMHFDAWFTQTYGVDAAMKHPDLVPSLVRSLYWAAFESHVQQWTCTVYVDYDRGRTFMSVKCLVEFGSGS